MTLPGRTDRSAGGGCLTGLLLSVFFFEFVVGPIIDILMLSTACLGSH
ncbi:hypothetical protein ACFSVK_01775 [Azorhizophilus paspali]